MLAGAVRRDPESHRNRPQWMQTADANFKITKLVIIKELTDTIDDSSKELENMENVDILELKDMKKN